MGLRSSVLLLATGAAVAVYAIPASRDEVTRRMEGVMHTIEGLLKEYTSSNPLEDKSPLRHLQQPYPVNQKINQESWNYRGNEWPSSWPILNKDGSYNKDYIRWHEGKHR